MARTRRNRLQLPVFSGEAMSTEELRELQASTERESQVQARIISALRSKRWMVVRINGGGWYDKQRRYVSAYTVAGFGSKGLPDLIAFRGGGGVIADSLFVEVKRRGGKPRPSQQQFIAFAADMGIAVHVCDSWEQVLKLVEGL